MSKGWVAAVVLFATLSVTVSGCGGSDEENRLAGEEALTLRLGEQNQSGQSGTATLTSLDGGRVRIVIELSRPPSVPQPAHIHRGSCDNLGLPVVALQSLEDGRSVTEAEITLEKLERRHLVIHAHKSEAEYDVSVACAAIAGLG